MPPIATELLRRRDPPLCAISRHSANENPDAAPGGLSTASYAIRLSLLLCASVATSRLLHRRGTLRRLLSSLPPRGRYFCGGKPNRTGFPSNRISPANWYAARSEPKWRATVDHEGKLASSSIRRAEIAPSRFASDDALTHVADGGGCRSQAVIEKRADRSSVRGSIAVTAIMGPRIASLIRPAAKRSPGAIVCCVANSNGMYPATIVRESVVRNEYDAHERCGREGEDEMAQHGRYLSVP